MDRIDIYTVAFGAILTLCFAIPIAIVLPLEIAIPINMGIGMILGVVSQRVLGRR